MQREVEPRQHLGWDRTHPDEWREGYSCEECDAYIAERRARFDASPAKQVYWNVRRLATDRESHMTQIGIGKEITEAARRDGREIERVR